MSSTTGLSWVLGRYDGATPYAIGGKLASVPAIEKHGENTLQAGTGTRKTDLHATNLYWSLDFRIKLQKIASYLSTYAMVSAEGALPAHNLYTYDGITKKGFTGCLVDKCNIEIGQTGAIMADLTVIALGNEDKNFTIIPDAESPMTKAALTTLSVGGTSKLSKFVSVRLGVDNHVMRQASGTGDAISDVYAKEATYTADIEIIKTGVLSYAYDTTKQQNVIIALTDNQSPPVTKTFTFANMGVRSNAYRVEELNITFERISGEGNSLVIS